MVEMEIIETQNETQDPSTSSAVADSARDDRGVVWSECLEHGNREFAAMLRILAEC